MKSGMRPARGFGVETLPVPSLTLLERGRDMDQDEPAPRPLDHPSYLGTGRVEGRDRRADRQPTVPRDLRGDEPDAQDVGLAVLAAEAQTLREMVAHDVAVERGDGAVAALEDVVHQGSGEGRLAGAGEPGEEEDGALLGRAAAGPSRGSPRRRRGSWHRGAGVAAKRERLGGKGPADAGEQPVVGRRRRRGRRPRRVRRPREHRGAGQPPAWHAPAPGRRCPAACRRPRRPAGSPPSPGRPRPRRWRRAHRSVSTRRTVTASSDPGGRAAWTAAGDR